MLVQAKILKGNLRLLDSVLDKASKQQETLDQLSGREDGGCGNYISANEELLDAMLDAVFLFAVSMALKCCTACNHL